GGREILAARSGRPRTAGVMCATRRLLGSRTRRAAGVERALSQPPVPPRQSGDWPSWPRAGVGAQIGAATCPASHLAQGGTVMKVFVAGGTGALGSALVPRLVAAGHEVVAMTRGESRSEA